MAWLMSLIYAGILLLIVNAHWPKSLWWLANAMEILPLGIVLGAPLLVFVAASAFIRDRMLFFFQFFLAIVLLIGVMGLEIHPSKKSSQASEHALRLMSVNLGPLKDPSQLKKYVQEVQPDVIVCQECNHAKFSAVQEMFPQWHSYVEGSGLGILSRFNIYATEAKSRESLGGWGSVVRHYALQTPSGMINLFNLHLETPREGLEALIHRRWQGIKEMKSVTDQQEQESALASAWVREFDHVIVVGDFNMTVRNPIFHRYWSFLKDAFSTAGQGFGHTKLTQWFGVRIDHVLTDPGWRILDVLVGPDVGSDHRPLVVDLMFSSGSARPESAVKISESLAPSTQAPKTPTDQIRKAVDLPQKPVIKQGEMIVPAMRISTRPEAELLISTGIPFAPGQLTDQRMVSVLDEARNEIPIATKVLARWPQDQSIRSVLVQFRYPIEHRLKSLVVRWGTPRSTENQAIVEPVWDYPEAYLVLPAVWLCDSQVIGEQIPFGVPEFKNYETKIDQYYPMVRDTPWTGDIAEDHYYDTAHVDYQFYVRSGILPFFLDARRELLHYRDTMIIQDGPDRGMARSGEQTRYVYVEAVADDYLLTGDPRSLQVAGYMVEYLKKKFPPAKAFYPKGATNFFTEREPAFPLLGVLTYYQLTQDPQDLAWAREVFENLYKTQLQWPDKGGFIHNLYAHDSEEGCRRDEYGGSPFMTGFLLEALIEYHRLTHDPKAADSIFRTVDWLIADGMTNSRDTFRYLTCDKYSKDDGVPDLNLAIVHGYGYAFRLSGYQDQRYFEIGQKILRKGLKEGYTARRKHFNQQFRSSGHYLAYVMGAKGASSAQGVSSEASVQVIIGENHQESFAVDLPGDVWPLDRFPQLHFKYRIQPGDSLGLKVQTTFGDWICLGGTKSFVCDATSVSDPVVLADDGQWNDVSVEAAQKIHQLLPSVKIVQAAEFVFGNLSGQGFDLDQWKLQ